MKRKEVKYARKTLALLFLSLLIATSFTWFFTKTYGEEIINEESIKVGDTEINLDTGEISIYKWNREEYIKIWNNASLKSYYKDGEEYILDFGLTKTKIYPIDESHEGTIWLEDGGLEYEIILDQKPITNIFTIPIQTSPELDFCYQPPLDEEEWDLGWIVNETTAVSPDGTEIHYRPPEIVGSYAIYHSSKRDDEYKTGKIGHILRPKFIDNKNNSIWGTLNYTNGQLEITVDSKYLENASYPVTIDPTIGYTSQGGSYYTATSGPLGRIDANYWWNASSSGVVQNISAYCRWYGSYNRLMLYWRETQSSQPVYRIASTDNFAEVGTMWKTIAINETWGNEIVPSGYYFLLVNHVGLRWYYDIGTPQRYRAYLNAIHPLNDDPPATISSWTGSGYDSKRRYSCYVTYEEEPAPGIANVTATTAFSATAYGWVNVTAVDYGGVANLNNVTIYANNSYMQNFTLYWNQTTDVFSETSDPDSICELYGSVSENLSAYVENVAFRFRLGGPVNETSFDAQITIFNDDGLNYTEEYSELFSYAGIEWDPIGDMIDSAFSIFGILDYMTTMFDFVDSISAHFANSILGMITLINLQFQVIWSVFSWFTDWATRIITAVLNLNNTIQDILSGVADGTVNLWVYFNIVAWVDIIPLGIILYWINSMQKRARTLGTFTVLWSDLQAFINIFSFFMSAFMTVVGIIENAVFRMINAIVPG